MSENGYLGSLLKKCLNNKTKTILSQERSLGFVTDPWAPVVRQFRVRLRAGYRPREKLLISN